MAGGVFGLLGLIALHRGAVEYDLRSRFGLGLRDVGGSITLFEVARLVAILQHDPSSAISAALSGWKHPISREALALYDIFDLDHQVAAGKKKVKPRTGRPWDDQPSRERRGNAAGRDKAEIRAILNAHGHDLPAPV